MKVTLIRCNVISVTKEGVKLYEQNNRYHLAFAKSWGVEKKTKN